SRHSNRLAPSLNAEVGTRRACSLPCDLALATIAEGGPRNRRLVLGGSKRNLADRTNRGRAIMARRAAKEKIAIKSAAPECAGRVESCADAFPASDREASSKWRAATG